LCSSTPLFPTPPLVSPNFPMFPLGYEERRCWANCPCMQLVSKISNLCDPDPPTSQTDRLTDGRHAISIIPRYALVHRAVKNVADWSMALSLFIARISRMTLKLFSPSFVCPFSYQILATPTAPYCVLNVLLNHIFEKDCEVVSTTSTGRRRLRSV